MGSNLCQKYFYYYSPHCFAISCGNNRNYKMEFLWKQTKNVSHQNNLKDATIKLNVKYVCFTFVLNYCCCLMLWHKKKIHWCAFFFFALSLFLHCVHQDLCRFSDHVTPSLSLWFFSLGPIWICGTTLKWTVTQQQG